MASADKKLRWARLCTAGVCLLGILLSSYAYHVETTKESDHSYTAMCDISEHISCSKVFTSRYGRGFGLLEYVVGKDSLLNQPNSVFGVGYYAMNLLLGGSNTIISAKAQIVFGILGILGALYLAYILYFILYDFCVVCVTTYLLNILICVLGFIKQSALKSVFSAKKLS